MAPVHHATVAHEVAPHHTVAHHATAVAHHVAPHHAATVAHHEVAPVHHATVVAPAHHGTVGHYEALHQDADHHVTVVEKQQKHHTTEEDHHLSETHHDEDPKFHRMTSEYIHGHEYDTYHLQDKKHQPVHFTVTRPEERDVVSKGAYYHAHPREVGPSYPHHDEHHYYETEVDHQQWDTRAVHEPLLAYHHDRVYDDEYTPKLGHYQYELDGDEYGHNMEIESVHETVAHHEVPRHHVYAGAEPEYDSWEHDLKHREHYSNDESSENYFAGDEPVQHYAPGEGTHFAHDPYARYGHGGYYEPYGSHHSYGYGYVYNSSPEEDKVDVADSTHEVVVDHHPVVVHGDHNVEQMDREHHSEHPSEHHDAERLHDMTHDHLVHGHHDAHYDEQEQFYDSPMHHGGLHGRYEDPMAHEGGHSYYEDEEHVPHFTHHSEEPLTHTEEYYYGAPIHHYHHDYHHTDVSHSCWKKAYGRTAGEPFSSCPDDKEKDGALCYPYCESGYSGVGPVCW